MTHEGQEVPEVDLVDIAQGTLEYGLDVNTVVKEDVLARATRPTIRGLGAVAQLGTQGDSYPSTGHADPSSFVDQS